MNDEIDRLLAIDFWESEYIKRKFYLDHISCFEIFSQRVVEVHNVQTEELGNDTLRFAMNAKLSQDFGKSTAFNFSIYTHEQLAVLNQFIEKSYIYGYYPNDLIAWIPSRLLVSCLYRGRTLPLPPLPFPFTEDAKFKLKIITRTIKLGIVKIPGQQIKIPEESHPIKFTHDGRGMNDALLIDLNRKYLYKYFETDSTFNDEDCKNFIKTRKYLTKASFQEKSNLSRSVGLLLWDRRNLRKVAVNSVINKFLSEKISMLIRKENNSPVDPRTLRQWHANTNKCIQQMKVLAI